MPELVPYTIVTQHTDAHGKVTEKETPKSLTRNGVTLPLYKGQFSKLSKDNGGLEFPYPTVDAKNETTFLNAIKFLTLDYAATKLTKGIRTRFGAIMVDCWNKETGTVDWEQWEEAAQDFTEGEEKRELLESELGDYNDKMVKITDSPEFMENPMKFTEALAHLGKLCTGIQGQLKVLQAKIDEKTAKRNATKKKNAEDLAKRQAELFAKKAEEKAAAIEAEQETADVNA